MTCVEDIIQELVQMRPLQARLFEDEVDFDGEGQAHVEPDQSERDMLLNALSVTPTSIDDLIESTGLAAASLQIILLELDLAGRIERSAGQLVALR